MPTQWFDPLGSRIAVLIVWTLMSWIPFALTFVLYLSGGDREVLGALTLAISIALEIVGVFRCLRIKLKFTDSELRFQNLLGSGAYLWTEIGEVTLRRYLSTRSADQQITAQMPRGLVGGLRPPAVAFRLLDGRLSPPMTITALLGVKSRSRLIDLLELYGAPRHINIRIMNERDGWPLGSVWDMRVGKGLKPDTIDRGNS